MRNPKLLTKLDLCIANVAGVEDPYNDSAWTTAKALKLDADIAAVLESPEKPAPDRTTLANAYARGMFTRDDLINARVVLALWVESLREKRLNGRPLPTSKEADMAYNNRPSESPRRSKGVDERAENRCRLTAEHRQQSMVEYLADIALDGEE